MADSVEMDVLMVCVSDPGKSTERTDYNSSIGDHPHDEHGVVLDIESSEHGHNFEQ